MSLCVKIGLCRELLASNKGKVERKQDCLYKIDHDAIKTVNLTGIQAEYSLSIPNNESYKSSERKTASLSHYLRRKEVLVSVNNFHYKKACGSIKKGSSQGHYRPINFLLLCALIAKSSLI